MLCCGIPREGECAEAYRMFNGRWYAQRQLTCEFSPVQRWKTAICGELVTASTHPYTCTLKLSQWIHFHIFRRLVCICEIKTFISGLVCVYSLSSVFM